MRYARGIDRGDEALLLSCYWEDAIEVHGPAYNGPAVPYLKEAAGRMRQNQPVMQHFIGKGLAAFETLLDDNGPFCHGDTPTMADCCLMPQLYNANRWGVDVSGFPKILRAAAAAEALDAFKNAHPDAIGAPPA